MKLSFKTILKFVSFWPPYLISGVRLISYDSDLSRIKVGLKSHFWNKNYFGVHFGGTLFSMCDPFYIFILGHKLGKDYIVWDKSAEIEYVKAISKPVSVEFYVSEKQIEKIKEDTLSNFSARPIFLNDIIDDFGEVIAKVKKTIYVRRKDAKERFKR